MVYCKQFLVQLSIKPPNGVKNHRSIKHYKEIVGERVSHNPRHEFSHSSPQTSFLNLCSQLPVISPMQILESRPRHWNPSRSIATKGLLIMQITLQLPTLMGKQQGFLLFQFLTFCILSLPLNLNSSLGCFSKLLICQSGKLDSYRCWISCNKENHTQQ